MKFIVTFVVLIVCSFCWPCQALRCRTEDGPGEEELKKISRLCMKKVGENESNSEDDNSGSSENGNDNDYYGTANRNRNDGTNFNNRNQRNKMNDNRYNQNQYNGQNVNYPGDGRDNSFGSLQSPARDSNWPSANGNGNSYDWNGNQSYGSMGPRGQGRAGTRSNQTEQDRACFVHCFYHELKLTNNDDQPDKFKMLTVLTRNIRDVELKQFLIDSIQQCFHMLEHMDTYRRRNDKCELAQTVTNCLTERAKANCDDFADDVMIL